MTSSTCALAALVRKLMPEYRRSRAFHAALINDVKFLPPAQHQHIVAQQRAVVEAVAPEQQVVEHGAALEQLDVLEGARDAAVHHLVARQARDVLPLEHDAAGRRVEHPCDDVEHRGLAGAVGPDDREHLALLDVEADIADRLHAAEAQRDVLDFEDTHL